MQRRSFLCGSILFVASAAIARGSAFGDQDEARRGDQQQPDAQDDRQRNQNEPPTADRPPAQGDSSGDSKKDPSTITYKDADGREYRECPQCGFNMYRQDRTWTCENCGYSYTE
jgi:ribosomal protein S27AE